MQVRDIMHTDVKFCSPESPLDTVALTMWNHDCGSVPIVDNQGRPIGIVTDRDIAMGCAIQHRPLWDIKSIDIAKDRSLFTCRLDEDISTALELMQQKQIRRVPVVDQEGKLAGILSLGDVVAHTGNGHGHRKSAIREESMLTTLKAVVAH